MADRALSLYCPPAGALVFCQARRTLRLPSMASVDLADKALLWRLASTLGERYLVEPGALIAREELIAAAWPGERIAPKAAQNRLAFALHKLRAQGLEHVVETAAGGAAIRKGTVVVFARALVERTARSDGPAKWRGRGTK
jgi:hypothetical protein